VLFTQVKVVQAARGAMAFDDRPQRAREALETIESTAEPLSPSYADCPAPSEAVIPTTSLSPASNEVASAETERRPRCTARGRETSVSSDEHGQRRRGWTPTAPNPNRRSSSPHRIDRSPRMQPHDGFRRRRGCATGAPRSLRRALLRAYAPRYSSLEIGAGARATFGA
jgi:hypothetical protein